MRISDWSSDVCSSDLEHEVARGKPAIERALPDRWMNVHKKKIAGIDRSVLHRVNHRVSRGVRRANIEKMHILVADLECEFAFESFRRGHQYIVFEVEILSPGGDELRSLAKRVRIVDNRLELFGS